MSTRGDGAGVLLNEYYERVQDAWGSAHEIHTGIIVPDRSTLETTVGGRVTCGARGAHVTELRFVRMSRRQDVIDAAVTPGSRKGGPDALTTVAVASRLGVTQSAIYRHVHNRDELATLASRQIVADLQAKMRGILDNPDLSWTNDGDTRSLLRRDRAP